MQYLSLCSRLISFIYIKNIYLYIHTHTLCPFLLFLIYFFTLHIPFPGPHIHPLTVQHPTPPPLPTRPHLHVDAPIPHPIWPLNCLGPPVSWGLGASSLNEHKPGSALLYVCWCPHISWCVLSVWLSSVWNSYPLFNVCVKCLSSFYLHHL